MAVPSLFSAGRLLHPSRRAVAAMISVAAMTALAFAASQLWPGRQTTAPPSSPASRPGSVGDLERSMLDSIAANGFDQNSQINHGLGGLWINWRYGTTPLQVNFNGSGNVDGPSVSPPRHDPFTDLRFLHNLLSYSAQHPGDSRYGSETSRFTAIVKAEFAAAHDERGWLFDQEFLDMYRLSHDSWYRDQAMSLAAAYARGIDPTAGIAFKTSPAHPQGYYRVDLTLEQGTALLQAGTLWNNPAWVELGRREIDFVFAHAYIGAYHTFPEIVDQVMTRGGQVNPDEVFYADHFRNYDVRGGCTRMGSISQVAVSLLNSYNVSGSLPILARARDLLDAFAASNNVLRLWDPANLGYFASACFSGAGPANPGSVTVDTTRKEAGRQLPMLTGFHLADAITHGHYLTGESQMLQVVTTKAYYPPGRGVMYETTAAWGPPPFPNHTAADVVTTEATGVALEALLASAN